MLEPILTFSKRYFLTKVTYYTIVSEIMYKLLGHNCFASFSLFGGVECIYLTRRQYQLKYMGSLATPTPTTTVTPYHTETSQSPRLGLFQSRECTMVLF